MRVVINLDDLGFEKVLSPVISDKVTQSITDTLSNVQDRWKEEANTRLASSKAEYINNIQPPNMLSQFSGEIELTGTAPNMIEKGFPSFDMKPGFARSTKRQRTKSNGWFLTIPMGNKASTVPVIAKDQYGVRTDSLSRIPQPTQQNRNPGLDRIVNGYNNTKFRRVSNNSPSSSWIHPGFVGVKIAESLVFYAKNNFMSLLSQNLNQIGGNIK